MKRQIVLGFTGALIIGVVLLLGACNKHGFEGDEFNTGTQKLFQAHGEGGHEDAHGEGGEHDEKAAHGEKKGHDSDKGGHHDEKKGDGHDKGHKSQKEHKAAESHPAKSLLPKK